MWRTGKLVVGVGVVLGLLYWVAQLRGTADRLAEQMVAAQVRLIVEQISHGSCRTTVEMLRRMEIDQKRLSLVLHRMQSVDKRLR